MLLEKQLACTQMFLKQSSYEYFFHFFQGKTNQATQKCRCGSGGDVHFWLLNESQKQKIKWHNSWLREKLNVVNLNLIVAIVMQGGKHCLCYCIKHKHFAIKLHPFTDLHTEYIFCLGHQEMLAETLLLAQNKVMSPDGWWHSQNFLLCNYLPLSTHSHINTRGGWYRLSFTHRNTVSWNRAGIICPELGTSSWMSTGLVKHGSGFSFYFPQELSRVF